MSPLLPLTWYLLDRENKKKKSKHSKNDWSPFDAIAPIRVNMRHGSNRRMLAIGVVIETVALLSVFTFHLAHMGGGILAVLSLVGMPAGANIALLGLFVNFRD